MEYEQAARESLHRRVPPSINSIERNPNQYDYQKTKHTAFGADRSSRKPCRTAERRTQQMPRPNRSTIRNGIKKCFAPIPGSMKPDCKPQTSRAAQGKAKEKTNESRKQRTRPVLTFIPEVDESKGTREGD